MPEKNALVLVLDQFNQEQTTITQRLEKAMAFVGQEKQQLVQLQEYEQEYLNKIQTSQQVWSVSHITRYRSFCHQLHHAVATQEEKVDLADTVVNQLREQLAIQKHKTQVLEALIAEKKREQQQQEDKLLQKAMDEFSSRKKTSPLR